MKKRKGKRITRASVHTLAKRITGLMGLFLIVGVLSGCEPTARQQTIAPDPAPDVAQPQQPVAPTLVDIADLLPMSSWEGFFQRSSNFLTLNLEFVLRNNTGISGADLGEVIIAIHKFDDDNILLDRTLTSARFSAGVENVRVSSLRTLNTTVDPAWGRVVVERRRIDEQGNLISGSSGDELITDMWIFDVHQDGNMILRNEVASSTAPPAIESAPTTTEAGDATAAVPADWTQVRGTFLEFFHPPTWRRSEFNGQFASVEFEYSGEFGWQRVTFGNLRDSFDNPTDEETFMAGLIPRTTRDFQFNDGTIGTMYRSEFDDSLTLYWINRDVFISVFVWGGAALQEEVEEAVTQVALTLTSLGAAQAPTDTTPQQPPTHNFILDRRIISEEGNISISIPSTWRSSTSSDNRISINDSEDGSIANMNVSITIDFFPASHARNHANLVTTWEPFDFDDGTEGFIQWNFYGPRSLILYGDFLAFEILPARQNSVSAVEDIVLAVARTMSWDSSIPSLLSPSLYSRTPRSQPSQVPLFYRRSIQLRIFQYEDFHRSMAAGVTRTQLSVAVDIQRNEVGNIVDSLRSLGHQNTPEYREAVLLLDRLNRF